MPAINRSRSLSPSLLSNATHRYIPYRKINTTYTFGQSQHKTSPPATIKTDSQDIEIKDGPEWKACKELERLNLVESVRALLITLVPLSILDWADADGSAATERCVSCRNYSSTCCSVSPTRRFGVQGLNRGADVSDDQCRLIDELYLCPQSSTLRPTSSSPVPYPTRRSIKHDQTFNLSLKRRVER